MIYIIIAILFVVCVIGYALYECVLRRDDPDMSDYSLIALLERYVFPHLAFVGIGL